MFIVGKVKHAILSFRWDFKVNSQRAYIPYPGLGIGAWRQALHESATSRIVFLRLAARSSLSPSNECLHLGTDGLAQSSGQIWQTGIFIANLPHLLCIWSLIWSDRYANTLTADHDWPEMRRKIIPGN